MEIQLQELIDQIKKDGVENAEREATSIIEAAKNEASKIVANARAEADRILSEAKKENECMIRVGEETIRQAGRNVLLAFRKGVERELDAVIGENVDKALSSDGLSELIFKIVLAWSKHPEVEDISVLLNSEDKNAIESSLLSSFKEHMLEGVTLKISDDFDGGLRIAVNGGRIYYDYSSDAITDMMSAYLNPKIAALLKEAGRE